MNLNQFLDNDSIRDSIQFVFEYLLLQGFMNNRNVWWMLWRLKLGNMLHIGVAVDGHVDGNTSASASGNTSGNTSGPTAANGYHTAAVNGNTIPPSPSLQPSSLLQLQSRKTLVLDLDETLVHSSTRGTRYDFMVEVQLPGTPICYYVYKRPHLDYFLHKVAEWFNLVVFTASVAEYADPVIDWLDSSRTLFTKRYFRGDCTPLGSGYVKDLTLVDKDLSRVCLLDNTPFCFGMHAENGIPIDTWTSDKNDESLLDLLPFLDALRFTRDVRSILQFRVPSLEEKSGGRYGVGIGF